MLHEKSELSINFKSIKVWNKLPADIRTSDALNVFMDNFKVLLPFTVLSSSLLYFLFLRYAVSLYNALPTKGQYSIDVTINFKL